MDRRPPSATGSVSHSGGVALICAADGIERQLLGKVLKNLGYAVIHADSTERLAELCDERHPDMVFMELGQTGRDDLARVDALRQQELDYFLPIILIADNPEEQSLAECMARGADDFLPTPLSEPLLKTRITAFERLRDLHHQASSLSAQVMKDQAIAETVFSGAVLANNVAEDRIQHLIKPAETFSGDVLLTAYAPSRDFNILLGDFTGHGLAAAIGALPTSEVFRAMTHKGFSPAQIISGINRKLHSLLPIDMFFAMQFAAVNHRLDYITVCNCGMPDMLLIDRATGELKARINSASLPLGIVPDINFNEVVQHIPIEPGSSLLMLSDGVPEARNPQNEYFGQNRVDAAITRRKAGSSCFDSIQQALMGFCQDAPQDDDITLAEVPLDETLLPEWSAPGISIKQHLNGSVVNDPIDFSLTLNGRRLREADPIPLVISHLQEIDGLSEHRRHLFTILTELYVNALDHGVLKLESSLKHSPEGFTHYFTTREQRLAELTEGFVSIRISSVSAGGQGRIHISIRDSGDGFDIERYKAHAAESDNMLLSGRGIKLVKELCESVVYQEPGNFVEATYYWSEQ